MGYYSAVLGDYQSYIGGDGNFHFGGASDNFIDFNGTQLVIDTDNFSVDELGNAMFGGTLQAAGGVFGDKDSGQYLEFADGVLQLGPNASVASNADRTVTVGPTGDYANLNAALTYISRTLPAYKNGGFEAIIELQDSFEMNETVAVTALNLSWVRIQKSTPLIINVNDGDATIFSFDYGALSPLLEFSVTMGANSDAINLFSASRGGKLNFNRTTFSPSRVYNLDNKVTSCISLNQGGELHMVGGSHTINDCFIGIGIISECTAVIRNTQISGCSYAVSLNGNSSADFDGCKIVNNSRGVSVKGLSRVNMRSTVSQFDSIDANGLYDFEVLTGGQVVVDISNSNVNANIAKNTFTTDGFLYEVS